MNRMEHQPEIIFRKPQVTSLDLSLFLCLKKSVLVIVLPMVAAFVFAYWWFVSYDMFVIRPM